MTMIGMEIHCQLKSNAKLFCSCPTNYLEVEPNTNICPICTGQPGSKPMAINEKALRNAVKIALTLGCEIQDFVYVQRKNYLYPDLPSGYQRTSKPVGIAGGLGKARIREVHIEEDPGRYEPRKGTVDYNRSGVPLIEIVTEPDFKSPEEAREFLEELSAILGYLNAGREEPGSTRIDANISLPGGTRVEVKNINSFRGVYTALSYEIVRQKNLLKRGKVVLRETRHYDETQGVTLPLRKKEMEEDYRYFPDPDVPPLVIKKEMIEKMRKEIPELPREKTNRFVKSYKIRREDAWVLVSEMELANLFEKMSKKFDSQKVAFWLRGAVKKQLNYRNLKLRESGLREEWLIELFELFANEKVTDKGMEKILISLFEKEKSPVEIAMEMDLMKVEVEEKELVKIVEEVISANEKAVEDYKKGIERALNFLVGQVAKETKGKVDSKRIMEIIIKKLEK